MPLFTRFNISLRCPQNVSVKFQLKISHIYDNLWCHFENAYFEWKQKHAVFVHVSLNANELLLPAPFSRMLWLYSSYLRYSAKKHVFGFDYYVYRTEIVRVSQTVQCPSTVVGGACKMWRHACSEKLLMIYGGLKKKEQVDFYRYRVVVYTHCQHTFMFKQQVNFA